MEAAGGNTATRRRPPGKHRAVLGAGGGGGCLLLLGGALAATAALGVAFLVRAATKQKPKKTMGTTPREAENKKTRNSEGRGKEAEDGQGFLPLIRSPPPQASLPPPPPPPLPQEEEDSISERGQAPIDQSPDAVSAPGADDSSATADKDGIVQGPDSVQVREKIIEESSPIGGVQEGDKDLLPAVVNKDVVGDESKIIQVVEEPPPAETASADASAREEEEEENSPVENVTEKITGETWDCSMEEADPPEVNWPAKAMEPSLPSLGLIHSPKPTALATQEEFAYGTGKKLGGVEVVETPWKESKGCVLDRMVVEMKEKGFSKNAQFVLLISIFFFTTMLAIWLHHYRTKLIEQSHIEEELDALL